MRGKLFFPTLAGVAILATLSSGCAVTKLKEANQRLKESNDRLISENNRLESELASLQRELEENQLKGPPAAPAEPAPAEPMVASNVSESILPPSLIGKVGEREDDEGIHLSVNNTVFFALGQAKLSSSGQRVLRQIGEVIRARYPNKTIRVEGHTDDIPVRKVRHLYPSNWELSTARACTVVRFLVDQVGLDPRQIYPAGFAFYKPLASGKSAQARSKNRRVEISILNSGMPGA